MLSLALHPPPRSPRSPRREELVRLIERLEGRDAPGQETGSEPASLSVTADDQAYARLEVGAIHEWICGEFRRRPPRSDWEAPLGVMLDVARRAAALRPERRLLWIGRRCWPYPGALSPDLLSRSLFLDPPDAGERLWAMDLGLRSRGVCVVVTDGSGLSMAATRRLQLAAASGERVLGLLARPPWEARELSAARTRWRLTPLPTSTNHPRWTVELLRRKGTRPSREAARSFVAQWEHETGAVRVVSDVHDRPLAPQGPAQLERCAATG